MPSIFFDIVFVLPKNIKIIWMCFGYEIYNDPYYFSTKNLLGASTKKYYKGPTPTIWGKFLKNIRIKEFKVNKKQQAIKRIDYIGTAFKEEFEAILKLTKTKKEFFHFWYYPLEIIVSTEQDIVKNRPNIIIGNSASITNNHIEAFKVLKKNKLIQNTEIIVPFSYSKDNHSKCVEKIGKEYFGDLISFLKNFMVLSEYNKILKSCGFAIFYNKRQQAIGNTIALLWYGAKVFLAPENPFYTFLKRKGVIVFSLDEIGFKTQLDAKEILHNKKVLKQLLSRQVLETNLTKELRKISID
ncbi:TDP-N-acetylfucosamine:lipid II N-acetylfucosaminyltransferase [Marixanthomonas sp. SCSIO 43207]|uniref:TDP-N-acetylfucosamine:lipid II N-acetylfucosaminyltransferase n=1 Tax=Marixanthomonas sp. SCSIO 43207 TaxID=2779360 RepID=UPI001CA7C729|nr:TDP-N-acetylfucosamine:lipid II N-acetylfucosaminyltransferase [Marixanthomonas sp. SCSIO 43207]UAB81234.1 TDP-N-acetylfucosamine:lipid II N-acetylfucosaminyltransferase [Marixanthomonas sp. SCSIO 43207]